MGKNNSTSVTTSRNYRYEDTVLPNGPLIIDLLTDTNTSAGNLSNESRRTSLEYEPRIFVSSETKACRFHVTRLTVLSVHGDGTWKLEWWSERTCVYTNWIRQKFLSASTSLQRQGSCCTGACFPKETNEMRAFCHPSTNSSRMLPSKVNRSPLSRFRSARPFTPSATRSSKPWRQASSLSGARRPRSQTM